MPFKPARFLLSALASAVILASPAAFAIGPQAIPEPDSPAVQALKSQLMDEVQSNLNWRTNYFNLQSQVGKLQADLQTAQNKVSELTPKSERPAGTVAGGDAGAAPK